MPAKRLTSMKRTPKFTDDDGCRIMPDGECVSKKPCVHSPRDPFEGPTDSDDCYWPKCRRPNGPVYSQGSRVRKLCSFHLDAIMQDGFPRQLVFEVLKLEPSPAERRQWVKAYSEREATEKGMPCKKCKKNVPGTDPKEVIAVLCWRCVMEGSRLGGAGARQYKHEASNEERPVYAQRQERTKRTKNPERVRKAEESLREIGNGKATYTFSGGKGDSTFTGGDKPGIVLVEDRKGITPYNLSNEVHFRIVSARLQRWLKKWDPQVSAGKTKLKGKLLPVRIKNA